MTEWHRAERYDPEPEPEREPEGNALHGAVWGLAIEGAAVAVGVAAWLVWRWLR